MQEKKQDQRYYWLGYFLEVILLVALFALSHGNPPPDANEAHYLAKAKHYWNPAFCPTDFFLSSADAHLLFYWSFGWLTQLFELSTVAWIGRCISWAILATGLVSLGRKLAAESGAGLLLGCSFVVLTESCHLAGEWVVGGFEAKTVAYGLAVWGIVKGLDGKWGLVWWLTGAAAAFHVLAGGWIVFCLLVVRGYCLVKTKTKPATREWVGLLGGGVLSLLGLVPGLMLSSSDAAVAAEANRLYVHVRLAHHLVVTSFATVRVVSFLMLVAGTWICWRLTSKWRTSSQSLLFGLAIVSLGIALTGVLVTIGLGDDSPLQHRLLRFYFYRTSDVLVPLVASTLITVIVCNVSRETGSGVRLRGSFLLVLAGLYLGNSLSDRYWDPRPRGDILALPHSKKQDLSERRANTLRIHRHWQLACMWMKNNTPADAIAITPLRQQTFKWYAHRGEVVTRKDMPQDAASLLQWHERRESVYPLVDGRRGLGRVPNDYIAANCERYRADYLVLTQFSSVSRRRFEGDSRFVKKFPPAGKFSYYAVFEYVGGE